MLQETRQDKFISSLSNNMRKKISASVSKGDREVAKDLAVIESSNHPLVIEAISASFLDSFHYFA